MKENRHYKVEIDTCTKELTAREQLRIKDLSNAKPIDKAIQGGATLTIKPVGYAVLLVHNESSENKDYAVYVIIDEDGTFYSTGSDTFFNTFVDIFETMSSESESYTIECYAAPSKKREGKYFITCRLL